MNYVPYQKCPVCDGKGFIWNTGTSSSLTSQCDVCNGIKIIPMCVLPEESAQDLNIDPILFKTEEASND